MTAPRPEWIFDGSEIADMHGRGDRAVEFLRALSHPKAPSGRFDLPEFWERIVRRIYGASDILGNRQVRTVYIELPRGARKTTMGAGLALLHTYGYERVPAGQVIAAAASEDQALLAYDEALSIARATPWLKDAARATASENLLEHRKSGATFRAVSSDGDIQHGKTPNFVLADELHAWKGRKLWAAFRTGLVKVPGTLLVVITTAGRGQESIAWDIHDYALKVACGGVADPGFLPIIFAAPADADWQDEELWHQVNPGLAEGFPDIDGMRQLAREAANRPADRDDFRQYHLNMWLDKAASPFVDMAVYDGGASAVDLDALEGKPCWVGVDMSVTTDLTAVVACWRDGADGYIVHPWFFCPQDNLRARADRDGVPYPRWAEDGFITPTPGNVIDYRAVEGLIRSLCKRFRVQEIAFDRAYAQPVMGPLNDDGLPVTTLQLGWVTQSPALNELERAIISGRFRHGGHPVLRWCFENVAIHTDPAGNRTMHKGKSRDRIDGAFATWMAVARAAAGEAPSIYESDEWSPELMVM